MMKRRDYYRFVAERTDLSLCQMLGVLDYLDLALAGQLIGCDCFQKGTDELCEHVLEAADDPMLCLLIEETRVKGQLEEHALAIALERAHVDPVRFADYRGSYRPEQPAREEPGTPEKRRVLRRRVKERQSVGHPEDNFHDPKRSRSLV